MSHGVGRRGDAQANEDLGQVQADRLGPEDALLQLADRFHDRRRQERDAVGDAGQRLDGVEDQSRGGVHERGVLAGDDRAVAKLHGRPDEDALVAFARRPGLVGRPPGRLDDAAVLRLDAELLHQQLGPLDGLLLDEAQRVLAGVAEEAADELLLGRLPADVVGGDAEAGRVAAHVGRRLVEGRLARDLLDDAPQDREDLDVAVVIDGRLAVGLEVEGVDEVEVADVGRCRLVGHVDGVLEGDVPDGEGLELGVARGQAAAVLVVELGQAGGQLAAARPRPGDDDQGVLGLDVVVGPVALVADDDVDVGRVALGEAVGVDPDALPLELVLEDAGGRLVVEPGDDDGLDADAPLAEVVDELEGVDVVGVAEVGPHLAAFDVAGVDAEQEIGLAAELLEELHLDVGVVAGQDPGGVVVEEKLAAELEVELVGEPGHPVEDGPLLFLEVAVVVEAGQGGHRGVAPFTSLKSSNSP